MEFGLETLRLAGFDGEQLVSAFRAFVAYTVGALLREVEATGAAGGVALEPAEPYLEAGGLDSREFPIVCELSGELAVCDHRAEFEAGLDLLIAGLAALLRSPP
jgi:hypothetical protein